MVKLFGQDVQLPGSQPAEPTRAQIQKMENEARESDVSDAIERQQDIQQELSLTGNTPNPYDDEVAPARDEFEHRRQVLNPTKHPSLYKYYEQRMPENRLGNIDDAERRIQDKYAALINSLLFRGAEEIAEMYLAEKLERLDHSASVDGFQQKIWQTKQVGLNRTVVHTAEPGKQGGL